MAINDNGTRDQYTATASQTVFTYTFEVFAKEDLSVDQNGTILTEGTHYTVSGVGNDSGGSVTLTTGAASGDTITIYREMKLERLSDYQQNGDFLSNEINTDFDRIWAAIQQTKTNFQSSIRPTITDAILSASNTELAASTVRANKALGFNSIGELDYLSGTMAVGNLRSYSTLAAAVADITNITIGDDIYLQERTTGNGGGAWWKAVDATTVTENEYDIVTGNASISLQIKTRPCMSLASFGVDVSGVVDSTTPIQLALDSGANTITGSYGDTYLTNDILTLNSPVTLDLKGATLNADFNASGSFIPAVHIASNGAKVTSGTINVTGTTGGGGFGLNCVFVGSLGAASAGFSDVTISRLTVSSDRTIDGALIGVMGGSSNILIENITVPDSVVSPNIVGCEWRGDETGTEHPRNITIRNIQVGAIDSAHTHLCWISSCFNVSIENVWAEKIGNGFYIYAGDRANEWADIAYKDLVGTGLNIKNSGCLDIQGASNASGVRVAGKGSTSAVMMPLELTMKNCRFKNTNSVPTSTESGIYAEQTSKFKISDCTFDGFYKGLSFAAFVTDFEIDKCQFINSYYNNGFVGTSTESQIATSGIIKNCLFKDGNTVDAASSLVGSNLTMYGDEVTVDNCTFDSAASTQGIYVVAPSKLNRLINNTFKAVRSTGFGILNDSSGNLTIETLASNNVFYGGVSPFAGRPTFYVENSQKIINGAAVPSNGTHTVGDRSYDSDIAPGGFIGYVCTTSGTFGTYSEGYTATTDGTTTVILSAESAVLYRGQYITINSTNARIVSLSGTTMEVDAAIGAGTGLAITYQTPVYKSFGVSLV